MPKIQSTQTKPITKDALLLVSLPPASPANNLQSNLPEAFPFSTLKLSYSLAYL